jgi:hypothetical protein
MIELNAQRPSLKKSFFRGVENFSPRNGWVGSFLKLGIPAKESGAMAFRGASPSYLKE